MESLFAKSAEVSNHMCESKNILNKTFKKMDRLDETISFSVSIVLLILTYVSLVVS